MSPANPGDSPPQNQQMSPGCRDTCRDGGGRQVVAVRNEPHHLSISSRRLNSGGGGQVVGGQMLVVVPGVSRCDSSLSESGAEFGAPGIASGH